MESQSPEVEVRKTPAATTKAETVPVPPPPNPTIPMTEEEKAGLPQQPPPDEAAVAVAKEVVEGNKQESENSRSEVKTESATAPPPGLKESQQNNSKAKPDSTSSAEDAKKNPAAAAGPATTASTTTTTTSKKSSSSAEKKKNNGGSNNKDKDASKPPHNRVRNAIISPPESSGVEAGEEIIKPNRHDVLFGRGSSFIQYEGNVRYRMAVCPYRGEYRTTPKSAKPSIIRKVMDAVERQDPPGRFLELVNDKWALVGHLRAFNKTSQLLREQSFQCPKECAHTKDFIFLVPPAACYAVERQKLAKEKAATARKEREEKKKKAAKMAIKAAKTDDKLAAVALPPSSSSPSVASPEDRTGYTGANKGKKRAKEGKEKDVPAQRPIKKLKLSKAKPKLLKPKPSPKNKRKPESYPGQPPEKCTRSGRVIRLSSKASQSEYERGSTPPQGKKSKSARTKGKGAAKSKKNDEGIEHEHERDVVQTQSNHPAGYGDTDDPWSVAKPPFYSDESEASESEDEDDLESLSEPPSHARRRTSVGKSEPPPLPKPSFLSEEPTCATAVYKEYQGLDEFANIPVAGGWVAYYDSRGGKLSLGKSNAVKYRFVRDLMSKLLQEAETEGKGLPEVIQVHEEKRKGKNTSFWDFYYEYTGEIGLHPCMYGSPGNKKAQPLPTTTQEEPPPPELPSSSCTTSTTTAGLPEGKADVIPTSKSKAVPPAEDGAPVSNPTFFYEEPTCAVAVYEEYRGLDGFENVPIPGGWEALWMRGKLNLGRNHAKYRVVRDLASKLHKEAETQGITVTQILQATEKTRKDENTAFWDFYYKNTGSKGKHPCSYDKPVKKAKHDDRGTVKHDLFEAASTTTAGSPGESAQGGNAEVVLSKEDGADYLRPEVELRPTDVILGYGKDVLLSQGNIGFHKVICQYREEYLNAKVGEKAIVAKKVMEKVAEQDPPGRFVDRNGDDKYSLVDAHRAFLKTCRLLIQPCQLLPAPESTLSGDEEKLPEKHSRFGRVVRPSSKVRESGLMQGSRDEHRREPTTQQDSGAINHVSAAASAEDAPADSEAPTGSSDQSSCVVPPEFEDITVDPTCISRVRDNDMRFMHDATVLEVESNCAQSAA